MADDIIQHYHIGAAEFGLLSAFFYYAYTPMQIPAGILFDKLKTRHLMVVTVTICAFGTLLFGITDSILIAAIGRFLIGFGSAFAFLGAIVLASRWLPHKYFALFVGFVQLLGSAGAIVGEKPIAIAVQHIGWQNTNLITAIIGFILAIMFWKLLREYPKNTKKKHKKHINKRILTQLSVVTKNPQNWWIGLYAFTIWAPASIFAVLWGIPFMMTLYNIDATLAASIISFVWIGIGIGCPLIGWWSDHVQKRLLPLRVAAILGIIISCFILYINTIPISLMFVLTFLLGLAIAAMTVTFGAIKDVNTPKVVGTANGFNNMATVLGGVLLQPLVGFILHFLWKGNILNNVPIYTLSSYQIALIMLPISFLIALITSTFFIRETNCKCVK